ncbi:Protein CBG27770 [Caenorhabditis briggsae]|uniref:Uncharacterized protein n=2 Tax=Caenorhabditis briggsae TaxID=6238 RepID=A0AAE8ZS62_CAEBR|nr:Protein CBG27770 [Caenorhabditis briggsae]ULT82882.1 hypothetical protein L3Y34_012254 [Caenorhabditis briggsae]CAR99537.1 Protein CBG27770 [Caenorhabditis briggsae]
MDQSIIQDIEDSPTESSSSPEYEDALGTAESSDHTEYQDAVSVHNSNSPDRSNDSDATDVVETEPSSGKDNNVSEGTSCSKGDRSDGLSDVATPEPGSSERGSTSVGSIDNKTGLDKEIQPEDKTKTQSISTSVKKPYDRDSTNPEEPSSKKVRSEGPSEHSQEHSSNNTSDSHIDSSPQKQPVSG